MILIACIDDDFGLSFNGRRQSRDKAVCADICSGLEGKRLWLSPRSAPLFEGMEADMFPCEDFAERCGSDEYCFLEFSYPSAMKSSTEKLIIYRWNRSYPSDIKFDISLEEWRLEELKEFPGSSHDKITKEVYVRE